MGTIQIDNDSTLRAMIDDYDKLTGVHAPSKHWKWLNDLNTLWLQQYGFERFKQTVNHNYFNWMVTPGSWLFRDALRGNHRWGKSFIRVLFSAITRKLRNPYYCVT